MTSTLFVNHAAPLTQITYAAASIAAGYTLAGSFTGPLVMGLIVSTLDQPVQISFDGTTVPVNIPLNFKDNLIVFQKCTVFVKRIGTPTTGNLYVCGFTNT